MHLVHLKPLLAVDPRYVSTLEKTKTSKVMAATADMTARLTQAIVSGLSGNTISLPAPVTMDNVVVTEDEITEQMRIDHCNAHIKDPTKYPLMGEKVAVKTDRKEVSLAATDSDKKTINYKCGKCGQKGHKSSDCPNKAKERTKASSGRSGVAGGSVSADDRGRQIKGNCNRCGKPGHMAKYCRSKTDKEGKDIKEDKAGSKEHANANVEIVLAHVDDEEHSPCASPAREPVEFLTPEAMRDE
eukprot:scaffold553_cov70-Cyclotella_meneghiniana.AAC.5